MEFAFADQVFDLIREKFGKDARLCFEPNGGNLGDILISASCIMALDRSGMRWEMLAGRPLATLDCDVIVYGGGGNLVPQYDGAARFLDRVNESGKAVVILPHTIRAHGNTICNIKSGIVFCRDHLSYQFVSELLGNDRLNGPAVHAAHDMAFSLRFDSFGMGAARDVGSACAAGGSEPRVLIAFRKDAEASGINLPEFIRRRNVDLSVAAAAVGSEKSSILVQAASFMTAISTYTQVFTDRLHVAIAAAMLGKKVFVFDNSYGKNGTIFHDSFAGRFGNVQYHCSPEAFSTLLRENM